MDKRSYYDVAMNDYSHFKWLVQGIHLDHTHNAIGVQAQQIVEKLLKHVLDRWCTEEDNTDLLRSHKVQTLVREIKKQTGFEVMKIEEALFLSDFYYGARYPGEDYIEVTLEEAQRAADIVDEVVQAVDRLRVQLKKEK